MVSFPLIPRSRGVFTGAYDDISSLLHVYEIARRTLTSYEGSLVRLRRASDNGESDFGYDSDGNLDTVAIAAWAGGASYVVTVYDQLTSGDDITQATAAKQPLFTASAQNGRAGLTFDGTDDYLYGDFAVNMTQPHTLYVVHEAHSDIINDGAKHMVTNGDAGNRECEFGKLHVGAPTNMYNMRANAALYSTSRCDTDPHLNTLVFNGASSAGWQDQVSDFGPGDAGSEAPGGIYIGAEIFGTDEFWKGNINVIIFVDAAADAAARAAMEAAIDDFWGVL